ncbi:MAG: hypothetical protein WBC13_00690, partial [Dokdonella sp.]
ASSLPPLLDLVGASLLATNEFRACSEFPWQASENQPALPSLRQGKLEQEVSVRGAIPWCRSTSSAQENSVRGEPVEP